MLFESTPIFGAFIVHPEPIFDNRGFFARAFCAEKFAAQRLESRFVQANISRSIHSGTLRGLHYQLGASAEVKLVRCTAGRLFDVALDLRPDSPSCGKWFGVDMSAGNHTMFYIPRGCAHGFISLEDETEILYLVSAAYDKAAERGVCYSDPQFAITWPRGVSHISDKDAGFEEFNPALHGVEQLRGLV